MAIPRATARVPWAEDPVRSRGRRHLEPDSATRTAFATRRGAAAGFGAGRLAARFCTAARDFGTATTRVRAVLRAGIFAFAAAVLVFPGVGLAAFRAWAAGRGFAATAFDFGRRVGLLRGVEAMALYSRHG